MNNLQSVIWTNFGLEVRTARGLLDLSKDALARATRLASASITRIEDGGGSDLVNAAILLQRFFEHEGVEFPRGTLAVAVALHSEKLQNGVAVVGDPSMPSGGRFFWG